MNDLPKTLPEPETPTPWWQVRMVWFAISGPLLVVVAATATAVIAFVGADPVLDEASRTAPTVARAPALQGRNHAATATPVR